jgi:hypothetical protein
MEVVARQAVLFNVALISALLSSCGGGGGASAPPPAPTVSLSASPTVISASGSSTLTWSSTNAASCTAGGAWSGSEPTSGTASVTPTSLPATFTLTCNGVGGSGSASTKVAAQGAPVAIVDTVGAVTEYAMVRLDGQNSGDSTAAIKSYAWEQTAGPTVALSGANGALAIFTAPHVTAATAATFSLKVTDDTGASATTTTTISIQPAAPGDLRVSILSLRFLRAVSDNSHAQFTHTSGPPLAGSILELAVNLTGAIKTATFKLLDAKGAVLGAPSMSVLGTPSIQPITFVGSITVPSVPFRVSVSGTTGDGQSYAVLSTNLISPMNMALDFVPAEIQLPAGQTGTSSLSIHNDGQAATFTVHFIDPQGLLASGQDLSIPIAAGASTSVPINVSYPQQGKPVGPTVIATAYVSGDPSRTGTVTLTVWRAGTP